MLALSTSDTSFAVHAQKALTGLNPEKDVDRIHNALQPSLAKSIPKPIVYHNYYVGDCKDLLFGVGLVDYANSRGLGEGDVPRVVRLCVREIDERGLDAEGIYRVSGRHANVQEVRTFPFHVLGCG